MDTTVFGVDLAKNYFQIHQAKVDGKKILSNKIHRNEFLTFFSNRKKATVYMEACASANFFARRLTALDIEPKLIPPQYVKPFVKRHKKSVLQNLFKFHLT